MGVCGSQVKQWMKIQPSDGFQWQCLFSSQLIVSGIGSLSLHDEAIQDTTLVPSYWLRNFFNNRYADFSADQRLPLTVVDDACVSVVGWGWNIYGHFLIEALPKLLGVRSIAPESWAELKFLVRSDTPEWFLDICNRNLDIRSNQFYSFDPQKERVLLKRGIFPCLPIQTGCFHPKIRDLIRDVRINESISEQTTRKIFISRIGLSEERKRIRGCSNEARLCEIAAKHGYTIYSPEKDDWDTQISYLRSASHIVGLAGSGLHGSLLCDRKPIVGSIGMHGMVQCQIASLMQQPFGALTDGVNISGQFTVPEGPFEKFLSGLN